MEKLKELIAFLKHMMNSGAGQKAGDNAAGKLDAVAAYGTSAGVGTSAAFVGPEWQQWTLFALAAAIGAVRLAIDGIRLWRTWKNKKAL